MLIRQGFSDGELLFSVLMRLGTRDSGGALRWCILDFAFGLAVSVEERREGGCEAFCMHHSVFLS